MRKVVVFLHVTLDGFVAGPDGAMDWIYVDEAMFEEAGAQTRQSDTALYGRTTFEMMDSYWPTAGSEPDASQHDKEHSAWYNQVQKLVVSNSWQGRTLPNARIIDGPLAATVADLKQQAGKDIVLFGSPSTAHALMQAKLVDELKLFVNPVILGAGIPLFSGIDTRRDLTLLSSKTYGPVVALHYQSK